VQRDGGLRGAGAEAWLLSGPFFMELSIRTTRIAASAVLATAAALVLIQIWSFGIWDPWELSAADLARRIAEGQAPTEDGSPLRIPPLAPWLVAQGFSIFGVHEWSGRIPIALTGIAAVGIGYWTVARFAGGRAGIYAALITATSPLFLFNARQMIGAAPSFATSALVMLCAASLVFHPDTTRLKGPAARAAWAIGLAIAIALATLASGFLLGVAPPLGAVAAVAIARGELSAERLRSDRTRFVISAVLVTATALLGIHLVRVIAANADVYDAWIGGAPRGSSPPTFEAVLEQIFHSFAPWSALLPIALGRALAGRAETEPGSGAPPPAPSADTETVLRLALPLWAAFGLAAQTVYISRFGTATFVPVVALAGAVALFLRDVERAGRGSWAAGVVVLLLAALLIRDFRGYPVTPASGLGVEGLVAPDVLDPGSLSGRRAFLPWVGLLAVFGLLATLGLSADRDERFDSIRDVALFRGPRELLRAQWDRGLSFRAWFVFFALLAVACSVFGVLCFAVGDGERPYEALLTAAAVTGGLAGLAWVVLIVSAIVGARRAGDRRFARIAGWSAIAAVVLTAVAISTGILGQPAISSIVVRVGKGIAFVVPAVIGVVLVTRLARYAFYRLGEWALVPMLAAGIAFGAYTSFGFQPMMSAHFSPREVYDSYNRLAAAGEPLGEYRVGGRAAAYYANGDVQEIADQNAAIEFLSSTERVWLAFRSDDLAQLNRAYRQRANRHLFVADASSASVLLATNQPIEGRENENYLADAILDAPPQPQHPVGADFDHRIELIGYDLDLPGGRTVGPGQSFTVTWYWRCRAPVPGSYQIFLHVDGQGQRLNGDHEPVDGRYPVRLWDEGDIVVDRQQLSVPANFPPGQYTFMIGFYAGESRLDVVSGPADDVDRVRAGTLIVR
jgi:hypothetical protein